VLGAGWAQALGAGTGGGAGTGRGRWVVRALCGAGAGLAGLGAVNQ